MYFGDSTVVTCMRAGLFQTKKGLLVFLGSLRSRKSITFKEISSSSVLERSQRQRAFVFAGLVLRRAVRRGARNHGARKGQARSRQRIHRSVDLREAFDRRVLARRRESLQGRGLVDVREAHTLHRIEVIEVPPELLNRCAVGSASVWSPRWFLPNSPVV